MLSNTAPGSVRTTRGHSSAGLEPFRNVFTNSLTQRPRAAAHVSASALTLEIVNNATPLVRRSRVFERALRNLPTLPNNLWLNKGVSFRDRALNQFVIFNRQPVTKEWKLEKNFFSYHFAHFPFITSH